MKWPFLIVMTSLVFLWVLGSLQAVYATSSSEIDVSAGTIIYERSCLVCHGVDGFGDGPAAFYNSAYSASRPRDFAVGNFKYRSTSSGEYPTDHDLFRIITNGIPGAMPSFGGLSESARWQVIAYLKAFSQDSNGEKPEVVVLPEPAIPTSSASVAQGRFVYLELDCHACHGVDGRGRVGLTQAKELIDSRNLPMPPSDLTLAGSFKIGPSARDIVRTLFTGLDGTPMPSYASQFHGRETDVWHLANYILSLSPSNE
jgi:cytochrome c oxidase cbb3-type subunit 2